MAYAAKLGIDQRLNKFTAEVVFAEGSSLDGKATAGHTKVAADWVNRLDAIILVAPLLHDL